MAYDHLIEDQPLPPSIDWIDLHPDCPRAVSRIVDLEDNIAELIAEAVRRQEEG